jgi:hypothetical protein
VTTVHRQEPKLTQPLDGPYHVIDAELTSGHRLVLTTDRPADRTWTTGEPITIGFRTVGGIMIPAVAVPNADQPDEPERRR